MLPANRVDASDWKGGECGSQRSFEERCFVRKEFLTGVVERTRRKST